MKFIQCQRPRPHGDDDDGVWEQPWPLPRRGPPDPKDDADQAEPHEPEED
jgi:hypothetical protein